jgi:hypothetical protein
MEWLDFVIDLVTDESKHFLLSSALGSLAFLSTSTISFAWFSFLKYKWKQSDVVYFILFYSLLVGLSFALLAHYSLDYGATWWETPMGPPLELKGS